MPVNLSPTTKSYLLGDLLSKISRSFYLTLAVLPASVRTQVGLAYLFARAADTITDTDLIEQSERIIHLKNFQKLFTLDTIDWKIVHSIQAALISHQALPAERILLERLEDCFKVYLECELLDRIRINDLMATITKGMEMDLESLSLSAAVSPNTLCSGLGDLANLRLQLHPCTGPLIAGRGHDRRRRAEDKRHHEGQFAVVRRRS